MRLKKSQKEKVLEWVAEGLQTDEINSRAAGLDDSFSVSRQQVDYYRKTRNADIKAIRSVSEKSALVEGYAIKETRVYKLSILAAMMEKDLFGGFLWTDDVKGVGSGDIAEIVDYELFNSAEVIQYRGVLDDIAKEVGGRILKSELTGKDGAPVVELMRPSEIVQTLASLMTTNDPEHTIITD
jgi:hypothetical protein